MTADQPHPPMADLSEPQPAIADPLKLTALIAALNATEEVDAALQGRLLQPEASKQNPAPAER